MRVVSTLVFLAGCGRLGFDEASAGLGDASGDAAADAPPACAFGPWSTPERLAQLATPNSELAPALHPNGLVLVYDTPIAGFRTLMISTRATQADPFVTSQVVTTLDEAGTDDMEAAWAPDGSQLFFHRNGATDSHLVASYLGGAAFGPPVPADHPDGDNPALSPDQTELWYTTHTVDSSSLGYARRSGTAWVPDLAPIASFGTTFSQGYPSFDAARQTLYVERTELANPKIFVATRSGPGAPFGAPTLVTELAEDGSFDGDPEISADGTTLFFTSERTGSVGNDLYVATRSCL